MGSKSKILKRFCGIFPSAENFYDVFGGGFSVTHFMIENRRSHFKNFYFNEIRPGICELIQDAIAGKYNYDVFLPKWVSREEFLKKKDFDPYIKMVWSFGNNGKDYLFNKDLECQKKSLHNAIVFNDFDNFSREILGVKSFHKGYGIKEKRLFLKNRLRSLKKFGRLDLEQLQQLQQLQQLEQLQRLQQLKTQKYNLFFTNLDYRKVEIKKNSVIYCDPPYKETTGYDYKFNHQEFYDWADSINEPVFISEYNINDKRFKCVKKILKRSLLNSDKKNTLIKEEKIFVNKKAFKLLKK